MIDKIINKSIYIIMFIVPIIIVPFAYTSLAKFVVLLICGLILFVALFNKRKELKFDLIDKILLLFWFIICLSTIFSINKPVSVFGTEGRFEGLLTYSVYFLTYYASKYYLEYNKKLQIYAIIIIVITAVIGIFQYYSTIYSSISYAKSTFTNSNFFGNFLAIVVPILMSLYINSAKKRYLILSGLTFFALIISLARSAWIGVAVACILGIIFIVKSKDKYLYIRALHLICLFIVLFVIAFKSADFFNSPNKIATKFLQANNSILESMENGELVNSAGSGRIGIWKMAIHLTAINPILGFGPDTLAFAGSYYTPVDMYNCCKASGVIADKAHNEYLQYSATIGIPGLIVYLVFIALILIKQKDIFTNKVSLTLSIPIISYVVQAFFNISTVGVAPIFWLLLGLIQNEKFKSKMNI